MPKCCGNVAPTATGKAPCNKIKRGPSGHTAGASFIISGDIAGAELLSAHSARRQMRLVYQGVLFFGLLA